MMMSEITIKGAVSMGVSKIQNLGFSKSMDLQWVLSDATHVAASVYKGGPYAHTRVIDIVHKI